MIVSLCWSMNIDFPEVPVEHEHELVESYRKVLGILSDYKIPSTFFPTGHTLEKLDQKYRDVLDLLMKFEVGTHSYAHPIFPTLPYKDADKQIGFDVMVYKKIFNSNPYLFVPPELAWDPTLPEILTKHGYEKTLIDDQVYSEPVLVEGIGAETIGIPVSTDISGLLWGYLDGAESINTVIREIRKKDTPLLSLLLPAATLYFKKRGDLIADLIIYLDEIPDIKLECIGEVKIDVKKRGFLSSSYIRSWQTSPDSIKLDAMCRELRGKIKDNKGWRYLLLAETSGGRSISSHVSRRKKCFEYIKKAQKILK